jgi:integrase/recombinase XerD
MAARVLEPRFVQVEKDGSRGVIVLSSGDYLELAALKQSHPIYSVVDSRGTVVKTVHAWLRLLGRTANLTNSINTVSQYGRILTYLVRWIERNGPYPSLSIDENILLLNREHIRRWLESMKEPGKLEHSTVHSREACLKSFLDWLTTNEAGKLRSAENSPYGRDGSQPYIVKKPNAKSPKSISEEAVVRILNGMHNECERCMFHTQYDIGLRITEMVNLTISDIPDATMYNPAFEFIPLYAPRTKGRGGQTTEKATLISRAVLNRIKRYHSSREYKLAPDWDINDPAKPAFLTANQLRWSPRNASKQFKNSVLRAEVSEDTSTHWLRHGTACSVLRSDLGKTYQDRMLLIKQMLGHALLSTTEIYTNIPVDLLQALTIEGKTMNRLQEAESIRERTFLAPLQHFEKRGHHG